MKVRTIGLLSLVGMTLSSVTVWSLTPDRLGPKPLAEAVTEVASDGRPTVAGEPGASFTAGRTLMVEGRLGHARVSGERDAETLMLVNVSADRSDTGGTITPVNLAIVIDRSGSMRGKRMENALGAARGMVRRLRDGDVVSVITYDTKTELVAAPTTIDAFSRDRVERQIGTITARGDTCISCGLDEAVSVLGRRPGMVDRILLLSDGEATAGVRDVEGFRAIAGRIRAQGASISAIGVDVEYNERVMSALAVESNGRHHFVDDAAGLSRVFDDELASLVKTVANEAELAVDLAPGVRVTQVFDRTFRQEGQRLLVPMGSFSAGEEKTLLVRVAVPRSAAGARPVADVQLRYRDLARSDAGECEGKLAVLVTDDGSATQQLDPIVHARLMRSQTGAALKEANLLFQSGRSEEARRKLNESWAQVQAQERTALAAAPSPRRAELEKDFKGQSAALTEASEGLAEPAPAAGAPPSPAQARKPKAQVRANAAKADAFGF